MEVTKCSLTQIKTQSKFRFRVSKNLDLSQYKIEDNKTKKLRPLKPNEKELVYWFMGSNQEYVYSEKRKYKDLKQGIPVKLQKGWITRSSQYLKKAYDDYSKLVSFLKTNKLVDVDPEYSYKTGQEHFCMGYKINDQFNSDFIDVYVEKNVRLIKNLNKLRHEYMENNEVNINLTYFLDQVKLDEEKYNEYLTNHFIHASDDEISFNKYKDIIQSVEEIKTGNFHPVRCKMGRFHTPLTNCKKLVREACYFDGGSVESMKTLDIKNSQPYFFSLLFNKNLMQNEKIRKVLSPFIDDIQFGIIDNYRFFDTDNCIEFQRLCQSGELYEFLEKELNDPIINAIKDYSVKRRAIKSMFFETVYGDPKKYYKKRIFRILNKHFPSITKFLISLTSGMDKSFLACLLQRFESFFVIDNIAKEIIENDGFECSPRIITVHDSITFEKDDMEVIIEKFKFVFESYNLPEPAFHTDYIS